MQEYKVGDRDMRPWGQYEVTGVGTEGGEEYCEKRITVNPGQVLSLQSHRLRREIWRVQAGALTVVLEDKVINVPEGGRIDIPLGALHAMANTGAAPVIVFERQQGVCREEDIVRYLDAYGRETQGESNARISASVAAYRTILEKIS